MFPPGRSRVVPRRATTPAGNGSPYWSRRGGSAAGMTFAISNRVVIGDMIHPPAEKNRFTDDTRTDEPAIRPT